MASTPVQTTYRENMKPPAPGTLIGGAKYDVITGNAQTDANGIPFGRVVSEGNKTTHGDRATTLGGALASMKGISIRDITLASHATLPDAYKDKDEMGIVRKGEVWVEPREAVVADDPVYFVAATGVLSNSASGAIGPIPGARWTSSSVDGRAKVYLPGLQNMDTFA